MSYILYCAVYNDVNVTITCHVTVSQRLFCTSGHVNVEHCMNQQKIRSLSEMVAFSSKGKGNAFPAVELFQEFCTREVFLKIKLNFQKSCRLSSFFPWCQGCSGSICVRTASYRMYQKEENFLQVINDSLTLQNIIKKKLNKILQ